MISKSANAILPVQFNTLGQGEGLLLCLFYRGFTWTKEVEYDRSETLREFIYLNKLMALLKFELYYTNFNISYLYTLDRFSNEKITNKTDNNKFREI